MYSPMENKAKAKMIKLETQNRKLMRLLNCKEMNKEDEILVDFYYEQRYYDLLVYANGGCAIMSIIPAFAFFGHKSM